LTSFLVYLYIYFFSFCFVIGGQYLIEVDRVLRPGGYWILSGPPIHWKKYFKGWLRTEEDLNSEQTTIENVAKSLCWKKVAEEGDIAIWQKPINHLNCKVNRKLNQNVPFCPAQDTDKAWLVLFLLSLHKKIHNLLMCQNGPTLLSYGFTIGINITFIIYQSKHVVLIIVKKKILCH
jgi:hypothetical protein